MRGNVVRASPIEVLTGVKPKLADIVIFGSPCTAIRKPKHKNLNYTWQERRDKGVPGDVHEGACGALNAAYREHQDPDEETIANSSDDFGHREEPRSDSKKPKKRGKREE
uniref:AlNc14C202G8715 protein n=1 Tax=Albugo laibachii Nc14 TaxID=890382 RepID=F0WQQ5_9STRA|nr:AlNc14C202G8715 [Albugo laibachii Nc14]CCA25325.1 AlNc14C291G10231 [Albugo laibachii Nc14]|eukprot:CCA25325.1 AlNc14C291G10231 [Albugo laibachii Nc14]